MNDKTDQWEFYTDRNGRSHWRWPAAAAPTTQQGTQQMMSSGARQSVGLPQQQRLQFAPSLNRGK